MLRTEHPASGWIQTLACALLVASQAACATPEQTLARREAGQRQALVTAIGTPRCERDAQCWAVPVGARACGGPEAYLPASRATADPKKVLQAATALAETRRAQHQTVGRMGICTVLPEPGARCEAAQQRCVLGDALSLR